MGKFGNAAMLTPAEVWAAAARTLTDISAEEIFDLPEIDSSYPAVEPISSNTADTFGSWVEVVADVGAGKRLLGVVIELETAGLGYEWAEIEIGEGESGSEAAITRAIYNAQWAGTMGGITGIYIPLWRSLTDNARLSVRVKDVAAGAATYHVGAQIA